MTNKHSKKASKIKESSFEDLLNRYKIENERKFNYETKFNSIDKILNGFYPGELVIVGGRPVMGKTAFLLNLVKNLCLDSVYKIPSLFITLELSLDQLFKRQIKTCNHLGKRFDSIILDLQNAEKFKTTPLYYWESRDGVDKIISKSNDYIEEKGVQIIYIDYIQLLGIFVKKPTIKFDSIIDKLKHLAVEKGIVIIISSQVSKDLEYREDSKIPLLSDVKNIDLMSCSIDKVIFLYRPENYKIMEDEKGNSTRSLVEVIIAKNNRGITGKGLLKFDDHTNQLNDYVHEEK